MNLKSKQILVLSFLASVAYAMEPTRVIVPTAVDVQPNLTIHPYAKPWEPGDPDLKQKYEAAILSTGETYMRTEKLRQDETQMANRLHAKKRSVKRHTWVDNKDHLKGVKSQLDELNEKVYEAELVGGPEYEDAIRARDAFMASQASQ